MIETFYSTLRLSILWMLFNQNGQVFPLELSILLKRIRAKQND